MLEEVANLFYKIYRRSACVFTAVIAVLMSAVLAFQQLLPDRYFTASGENLAFSSSYKNLVTFGGSKASTEVISHSASSYSTQLRLLGIIPIKSVHVEVTDDTTVTVCGSPFGIKMFTDGVLIVGLSRVSAEHGFVCPAVECGISEGDIICSVNGERVYTNEDVALSISNSGGSALSMLIKRGEKMSTVSVTPVLTSEGDYKIGVWVRDSSAGIGTLTFYDSESMGFAGLGHAVCDIDTGEALSLLSGEVVPATVNRVKKGAAGSPGELCGSFLSTEAMGTILQNGEAGVYGVLSTAPSGTILPIAPKQEVHEGAAVILSTVSGNTPKEYEISIEKISLTENTLTKNMVIKVTDPKLLKTTGGIVQGMSGSPIIQDGKLVGAVTHVFVNDPTKGYAIFAENMYSVSCEAK